jgi:hypothetical protein
MSVIDVASVSEVLFPRDLYGAFVEHCRRKFRAEYEPGEHHERQAFGLLGGAVERGGERIVISHVFPLIRNMRHSELYADDITALMEKIGPGSAEFPNCARGWVSNPRELMAAERTCDRSGSVLFGNYHMHTMSGDRCTPADRQLGEGNSMWSFIVSMVDTERYIVRAYYEGRNEREAPIRFIAG